MSLVNLLFALGIAGMIFCSYGLFTNFHNVDLSYNICLLSNDYGVNYRNMQDQYNTAGDTVHYEDAYIAGTTYMVWCAMGMFLSGWVLGWSISEMSIFQKELIKLKGGKKK